ncbi:hypothetical protein REPUB_Repub13aG0011000 [Reevesia pubescens]
MENRLDSPVTPKRSSIDSPVTTTPPPIRRKETQLVSLIYYFDSSGKKISISKNVYYSLFIHALKKKLESLLLTRPEEDPETSRRRKIKLLMSMR